MKFKGSFAPTISHWLVFANATLFGAYAVFVTVGPSTGGIADFFNHYVFSAAILLPALICFLRGFNVPAERRIWLAIGLGILAWWAGDLYGWRVLEGTGAAAGPSFADVLYLAFYPAVFIGFYLLFRRLTDVPRSLWLQGVIAALSIAAIDTALVLEPLQRHASTDSVEIAASIAYPLADLMLLMLVIGAWVVTGHRLGTAWKWLTGGILMLCVADSLYLFQLATDQYVVGSLVDITWPGAMLMMAVAAIKDDGRAPSKLELNRRWLVVPPVLFASACVFLFIWDHFHAVGFQAIAPALAAMIITILELALSNSENVTLLDRHRAQAFSDSVTGLPNRRALLRDLEITCRNATDQLPAALIVLDLTGFKSFNDKFGHAAGDGQLTRIGRKLEFAVGGFGRAYRLSGDEFCVIARVREFTGEEIAQIAESALIDHGDGFAIGAICGSVIIPVDTADPMLALKIADQRMYAQKYRNTTIAPEEAAGMVQMFQSTATSQDARSVLINETLKLAASVIGMAGDEIAQTSRGFELRDIGNCAIPEAILNKKGKLSEHEWQIIHSHPVVGERILNSIPSLRAIAPIVRHSHERFDGEGYPDGLSSEAIPVGSRLVSIAAAFDAMITDRTYREAMSFKEAVHELGSSAGTQFDPRAVSAFCQALDTTADAIQERTKNPMPGRVSRIGHDGATVPTIPANPAIAPQRPAVRRPMVAAMVPPAPRPVATPGATPVASLPIRKTAPRVISTGTDRAAVAESLSRAFTAGPQSGMSR